MKVLMKPKITKPWNNEMYNYNDEVADLMKQNIIKSIKKNKNEASRIQALNSIINISKDMMSSTRELIKKLSLGILEEMGFEIAINDLVDNFSKRHPKVLINYFYDKINFIQENNHLLLKN